MTDLMLTVERTKSQDDLGGQTNAEANSLSSNPHDGESARLDIKISREKNSLVQINQFPTELLVAIFYASLEGFRDRFEGLKTIASVAWLWYSIVKESHWLWTVLDSRTPREHLPIFLQRAGHLPLNIKMHPELLSLNFDVDQEDSPNTAFLATVLPELSRWKEASLILHGGHWDFQEKLEQPAPLLKKFHMECETFGEGPPQFDLFQGQAPELAELSIQGLPIRWNTSIFSNLVSISIWGIPGSGPTVEDVLQWIVSSARLRSFQLCGSPLSPSTTHQDILPVETPQLKSLNISDIPSSSIKHVLSRIRAPTLRELVVRPDPPTVTERDSVDLPKFFDASLLHFSPAIGSSISHAQSLTISMYAPRGSMSVSTTQEADRNEGIAIDFDHQPGISGLRLCLELLLRDVSICPPTSLSIVGLNEVSEKDLLWILDNAINEHVTDLSIRNSGDDSFLAFLCKERYLGGVVKWPFPKLKRLSIPNRAVVSVERLARLLTQRYAPDVEELSSTPTPDPQSPLILEGPDRLDSLAIENATFSRSDYNILASIVGDGFIGARVED
ncbi:hypothetical protein FS837_011360 [Tulasnella sp. UAMH 9824]|nr:hypothetical protein FS837_011360 [Tulasnella sp. UAMH 9824]